jgi:hypothetical protein
MPKKYIYADSADNFEILLYLSSCQTTHANNNLSTEKISVKISVTVGNDNQAGKLYTSVARI